MREERAVTSVEAQTGKSQEQLLSIRELASRLNVPLSTVYGWRYKGSGPRGFRVGRHVRFRWSDVEKWLEEHADDP